MRVREIRTAIGVRRSDRGRLSPPRTFASLCERENQSTSLDRLLQARVTLIIGPAGYGKTTIISQWCERLAEQGVGYAYYAASARDQEPVRFIAMLAAALERVGIDAQDLIDDHSAPAETMMDNMLTKLDRLDAPFVLFIDEFEQVACPAIDRFAALLIADAPSSMRIVLSARRRPDITLSALELNGELNIFDIAQLRFSARETAALLGLPETSRELAEIVELTQGWAVAVQLYRLWLERAPPGGSQPNGGRSIDEVKHYLTEQLFSSLPPEQLALLRDVACLEEVEADLVDIMRGRSDSGILLEQTALSLSSLMWRSEGEAGAVYRLHPLLLNHLRLDLAPEPARRRWLSANASTWYLHRHRYAEAVRTAIASDQAETIEQTIRSLRPLHIFLAQGASALRDILRELPEEEIKAHPRLRVMAALAHFKAGFFPEAKLMLDHIRTETHDFREDPGGQPRALAAEGNFAEMVMNGQIAHFTGRMDELYQVVVETADDDPLLWGACEHVMILVAQHRSDLSAAKNSIVRARRIYQSAGITRWASLQLIGQELLVALAEGKLREAASMIGGYRRGAALVVSDDRSVPAILKIVLAAIRYETDFDDDAADMLQLGLTELGPSEALFDQYAITYGGMLSRLLQREGVPEVLRALDEMRHATSRIGVEGLARFLDWLEIEYMARGGDADAAARKADQAGLASFVAEGRHNPMPHWRERDAAACALVTLHRALGSAAAAHRAALDMVEDGRRHGRLRTEIKGLVLAAISGPAGQDDLAVAAMHRALLLAQPEGILAAFAEEGEALRPLLAVLDANPELDVYARRHLGAITRALNASAPRANGNDLNAREREILDHLAAGASNKVIARRMGVTDNTVKFHLKKIFAKLGVSTRRAAVAKVAQRKLPETG